MDPISRSVFSRHLTDGARVRRFDVDKAPGEGWRIRDERDPDGIRQITYEDWHRVELAIQGFAAEAAQLTREGWHDR